LLEISIADCVEVDILYYYVFMILNQFQFYFVQFKII
jgi:hypothetical protein